MAMGVLVKGVFPDIPFREAVPAERFDQIVLNAYPTPEAVTALLTFLCARSRFQDDFSLSIR